MLKHVDIFSGIGGFPLGFEWAGLSEPSMFCEIDPWCRQVLGKHWPTVPITNDVKELANDPEKLIPDCDILTGGYPCQPFSVAGKQKAHEDDRHLWPYLYEIITCKRPTYAVLENVYGHIGLGLDTVLLDLETEGYSTRTFVVPACSVNAPHRRDRLWIIAKNVGNTKHNGSPTTTLRRSTDETSNDISQGTQEAKQSARTGGRENDGFVAYSDGKGLEGRKDSRDSEEEGQINNEQSTRCSDRTTVADSDSIDQWARNRSQQSQRNPTGECISDSRSVGIKRLVADSDSQRGSCRSTWREDAEDVGQSSRGEGNYRSRVEAWEFEPNVGRVAHGIPKRVDRLRGLGNAIVPQIAMQIGLTIKEMELCKKKL